MTEKEPLTLKEALDLAQSLVPVEEIRCEQYEATRDALISALFDYAKHIQKEYESHSNRISHPSYKILNPLPATPSITKEKRQSFVDQMMSSLKR